MLHSDLVHIDQTQLIEGSDRRGLVGHGDNSDGGVLSPLDGAMSFVGNVLGYGGAQVLEDAKNNDNSGLGSGGTVQAGHHVANMWWNWIDKNTDMICKDWASSEI